MVLDQNEVITNKKILYMHNKIVYTEDSPILLLQF